LSINQKTFQQLVAVIHNPRTVFADGFSNLLILSDGGEDAVSLLRETGPLFEALAQHVETRQEERAAALDGKMDAIGHLLDFAAATDPDEEPKNDGK
jgi:hypothetical protein